MTLRPAGQSWALIDNLVTRAKSLTALQLSHALRAGHTALYNEFLRGLAGHDVIVAPTTPSPAILHSDAKSDDATSIDERGGAQMQLHSFTEPPTHAGLPAISIPAGFTDAGLPVGMQIIGSIHDDVQILRVAAGFVAPWAGRRPSLAS